MLLPCCSYIAWPICRLQSEIRGAFIPIFMNNLKVILCWSYGAAASRNGPSFPLVVIASFLLHCIRTTLSRAGFETWFGWKWSFEFSPSYFSARSAPCSHSQHSHRLGSFGTRRRWDHWVRATPFCKGQTVSAQCPRVQGKHWAELAEQGPCYGSSTGPTAALTHTLPSGFTPMRGSLHLCRPRLKMQPLPPAWWLRLWEATGMGNGALPLSATDTLVPAKCWPCGGAELRYTSRWVRVPRVFSMIIFCLCMSQSWVCLMQDKASQILFFFAVRILCVALWL